MLFCFENLTKILEIFSFGASSWSGRLSQPQPLPADRAALRLPATCVTLYLEVRYGIAVYLLAGKGWLVSWLPERLSQLLDAGKDPQGTGRNAHGPI
jgi:hypothetical protein